MNYSYYKFDLIDDVVENKMNDLIIKNGFDKVYSKTQRENIEIEVYQKSKHPAFNNKFPIYILYVKSPYINKEDLDLILNYHLIEAGVPLPIADEYVWVYAIFNVEDYFKNDCLQNFIKYGLLNSFHSRQGYRKRTQLPIVYDRKNKTLFIGNRTHRRTRMILDIVYEQLKEYYEQKKLDINNNHSIIELENGTEFKENIYPEKIIYTKHSRHYSITKLLFIGFSLSSLILFLIYERIRRSFIPINVIIISMLAVAFLLWKTINESINITKKYYSDFKKIKIEESSFYIFISKFKKVLISEHYIEKNSNLFSNKKIRFYLIDNNYSCKDMDILPNSYVIVDSYDTYRSFNISKTELVKKNIVLLVYDNNFLDIINGNDRNNLRMIHKLIDKVYRL